MGRKIFSESPWVGRLAARAAGQSHRHVSLPLEGMYNKETDPKAEEIYCLCAELHAQIELALMELEPCLLYN